MNVEEHRPALIVTVCVYGTVLVASVLWAHRREQQLFRNTDGNGTVHHSPSRPAPTDNYARRNHVHYLGGKTFGPLLTTGTVFASLFAGYSIIGVPNDSFYAGWISLMWLPSTLGIVVGYFGTAPRLRKCGLMRNHSSPVDFITDRFQSQVLRYTVLPLQILPAIVYLSGQAIALKLSFNSVFSINPDSNVPTVCIFLLVVVFEWLGGITSVALTDAVQGLLIATFFLVMPFLIRHHFGGWDDLQLDVYPRPDFYQTPSREAQWTFWQFALINLGFFTLPHLIQRIYAARDLRSLKVAFSTITAGAWISQFVGVFIGTIAVQVLGPGARPPSPFNAILFRLMEFGGFSKFVASVTATAILAAIMSTVDSLTLAVSQLVMNEIVQPLVRPPSPSTVSDDITDTHGGVFAWVHLHIDWIGRIVSLAVVILALVVGLEWDERARDLLEIQFSLSLMALPAFGLGLFGTYDPHPWSIAIAALASTVYVVVFYFGYTKPDSKNFKPINGGTSGLALNFFLICILEGTRTLLCRTNRRSSDKITCGQRSAKVKESITQLVIETASEEQKEGDFNVSGASSVVDGGGFSEQSAVKQLGTSLSLLHSNRPEWDVPDNLHRFGKQPLSSDAVWSMMAGFREPMANPYYVLFVLLGLSLTTPLSPESEPPIIDRRFAYTPAMFRGVPWWAAKAMLFALIPTLLVLYEICRMPVEYPDDCFNPTNESGDRALHEMQPLTRDDVRNGGGSAGRVKRGNDEHI